MNICSSKAIFRNHTFRSFLRTTLLLIQYCFPSHSLLIGNRQFPGKRTTIVSTILFSSLCWILFSICAVLPRKWQSKCQVSENSQARQSWRDNSPSWHSPQHPLFLHHRILFSSMEHKVTILVVFAYCKEIFMFYYSFKLISSFCQVLFIWFSRLSMLPNSIKDSLEWFW